MTAAMHVYILLGCVVALCIMKPTDGLQACCYSQHVRLYGTALAMSYRGPVDAACANQHWYEQH